CDSTNGSGEIHSGFGLKSSGSYLGLYQGGALVDSNSFGLQIADFTIGRIPSGPTGAWTLNRPSPGAANIGQALGSISGLRLNEWMATNSAGPDWLELYNPSTNPVALAGLVFTSVVPGTMVPTNTPIKTNSFIEAE